jgi:hypothetical protein
MLSPAEKTNPTNKPQGSGPTNATEPRRPRPQKPRVLICNYCKEEGHKIAECTKIRCRRCGYRGHVDKDCTTKICEHCSKRGHLIADCYSFKCTRCGKRCHLADDCTETIECRYCKEEGHMVRECPNIRCRNCEENHFSNECPYMYDDRREYNYSITF